MSEIEKAILYLKNLLHHHYRTKIHETELPIEKFLKTAIEALKEKAERERKMPCELYKNGEPTGIVSLKTKEELEIENEYF